MHIQTLYEKKICIYISTWIFEKVDPEDLPILTGTTPKLGFLDSHEPRNHTGEKREGRGERGEEKKDCWHS